MKQFTYSLICVYLIVEYVIHAFFFSIVNHISHFSQKQLLFQMERVLILFEFNTRFCCSLISKYQEAGCDFPGTQAFFNTVFLSLSFFSLSTTASRQPQHPRPRSSVQNCNILVYLSILLKSSRFMQIDLEKRTTARTASSVLRNRSKH